MSQLQFTNVSFSYDSSPRPLFNDLTVSFPRGWTGIVGPNGSGKTTLLGLAGGRIWPSGGAVVRPESHVHCEQRTDVVPDELTDLLCYPDAHAGRLASMLGLDAGWPYRWDTLSHGERKRTQIAVALWQEPELLTLDEPTNHLDAESRELLLEAMLRFGGVGLIVSHDRSTLDALVARCLFLDLHEPPAIRPGGVTAGLEEWDRERTGQERDYAKAAKTVQRLELEAARRSGEGRVQDRRRSKAGLSRKDSDAREKIDRARVSGADGTAGRLLTQMDGRRSQAAERLEQLDRPVSLRLGISANGVRSKRDALLTRPAGRLRLPNGLNVEHPDLRVAGGDRIAVQGANGTGKTTLVSSLLGAADLPPGELLVVEQELTASEGRRLKQDMLELTPDARGRVVSTISRLGSDPDAILATSEPSPGEARKIKLALGLERRPAIIVMDEPTNHLDLTSIRCLETALGSFEGALLLVSHDQAFAEALASTRWEILDGRIYVRETRRE